MGQGGNARTALVCCVSADEDKETRRTLEFGSLSARVTNAARVNVRADDDAMAAMASRVAAAAAERIALHARLEQLQAALSAVTDELDALNQNHDAAVCQVRGGLGGFGLRSVWDIERSLMVRANTHAAACACTGGQAQVRAGAAEQVHRGAGG